jgi:hypothetical protein
LNKLDTNRRTVACPFVLPDQGEKKIEFAERERVPYTFWEFPERRHTKAGKKRRQKNGERVRAPRPSFLDFPPLHLPSQTRGLRSSFLARSTTSSLSRPLLALLLSFAVLSLQFLPVYLPATSFIPTRSSLPQIEFHFFFRFVLLMHHTYPRL